MVREESSSGGDRSDLEDIDESGGVEMDVELEDEGVERWSSFGGGGRVLGLGIGGIGEVILATYRIGNTILK